MATQFTNFKLSFIWVETIPDIFAQELAEAAPYAFLGKPGQFAKKFDELKSGESKDFELPWPKPKGHNFWKHYFAGRHAGDISGIDGWKNHVPLRSKTPVQITLDPATPNEPPRPRVTFEFSHPQGVGPAANVSPAESLDEIAAPAHAVRHRY